MVNHDVWLLGDWHDIEAGLLEDIENGEFDMATFIPANETDMVREMMPSNGRVFKLAELYSLLSCDMIEIRYLPDGHMMILDEEGKLVDEPQRNVRATYLARFPTVAQFTADLLMLRESGIEIIRAEPTSITDLTSEVDYIAGDVLICEESEME